MTTNGLSIASGTADIEISDGSNTYGYPLANGARLTEKRGSNFVPNVSTTAPTYQDAEPFNKKAWESFDGGMGQLDDNTVYGGPGMGGAPNKYADGDCFTLKGGVILPGPRRQLVYPTYGTQSVVGDEYEMPQGVIPSPVAYTSFTTSSLNGKDYQSFQVLVRLDASGLTGNINIFGNLDGNTYSATITPTQYENYSNWKWVTLTGGGTNIVSVGTHTLYVWTDTPSACAFGCFIGQMGAVQDAIQPYLMINQAAQDIANYKWWPYPLLAVVYLTDTSNGNKRIPIGIFHSGAGVAQYANLSTPNVAPYTLAGGVIGYAVINNTLIISTDTTNATYTWTAAAAKTNAAPSATWTSVTWKCITYFKGNYYYSYQGVLYKWAGNVNGPVSPLVADGTFGQAFVNGAIEINNLFVYKGFLYIFKSDGIWMLYDELDNVTANKTPRVEKMYDLTYFTDIKNGRYVLEMAGKLYFNQGNAVMEIDLSSGSFVVTPYICPFVLGRYMQNAWVNGLTTDGTTLYVGYGNIGLYAMQAGNWHPITGFYYLNASPYTNTGNSGLCYLQDPTNNTDFLYGGDGYYVYKLPMPSNRATVTAQAYYQSHMNKCGWIAFSITDFNYSVITKYINSVFLKGYGNRWRVKIQGAVFQGNILDPSYRGTLIRSINEGILRDNWANATALNYGQQNNLTANVGPAIISWTDLQNKFMVTKKPVSSDNVSKGLEAGSLAVIVYFWQVDGTSQGQSAKNDPFYIQNVVLDYLPILDYIPLYEVAIDIESLWRNTSLTTQQVANSIEFLRMSSGRHSPLRMTFRDMNNTALPNKTVEGIMQNWSQDRYPGTTYDGSPVARTATFNFLAFQSEYGSL